MLIIYGVPNSQPVRAVLWPCLMKGLKFELRLTSQNKDAKRPEYLDHVNPRGTVPAIDDAGFVLWESHAIMIYLAEKYQWEDLWPSEPAARARVNQYLHFHHRNTRELVVRWSERIWPSVFGVSAPDPEWLSRNTFRGLHDNEAICNQTLGILEGMLSQSRFLGGTEGPSLADVSAYEELGQNQPKFANCDDYQNYPALQRWLAEMERLPGHDVAHQIWSLIGDVDRIEGGMGAIARANKAAAASIRAAVDAMPN